MALRPKRVSCQNLETLHLLFRQEPKCRRQCSQCASRRNWAKAKQVSGSAAACRRGGLVLARTIHATTLTQTSCRCQRARRALASYLERAATLLYRAQRLLARGAPFPRSFLLPFGCLRAPWLLGLLPLGPLGPRPALWNRRASPWGGCGGTCRRSPAGSWTRAPWLAAAPLNPPCRGAP